MFKRLYTKYNSRTSNRKTMIDFKIISDTEEEIEFEITQPNDLLGDTKEWNDEDWEKWNKKMEEVEAQGIKGQLETIKIKLKKNPFINGKNYTG